MPFLLIILALIILILVAVFFTLYKENSPTALYNEGVQNENEGRYNLAMQNYEDALREVRKLKRGKKFGIKIAQRIRILRTTIDYEKNFRIARDA
jgi:uncharacterized membrane protein YqiK